MTTQQAFESRIGDIVRLAEPRFRRLGPEAKDEAMQNTLALAWKFWLRLVEQGKDGDETIFRAMIHYATKHTKLGRRPQGYSNRHHRCVLDYARRGKGEVALEEVYLNFLVGRSATVPDAVAFMVDTPEFLATLTDRQRGIACDLSIGMATSEVAQKWGVTAGAISQFRVRFKLLYDKFHGER